MSTIQLEGSLKFGLSTADTEYGDAVTAITLQFRRAAINIAPTYANAEGYEAAGARARSASITFKSDPTSAAALSELIIAAYETDSGELKWQGTPDVGDVSATNPLHSGTLIVRDVDLQFGEVGTERIQTQQFVIKAGTYNKTTTP